MAPTRELAQQVCSLTINKICNFCLQIQKVMISLGSYMNVKVHACIGGTSIRDDLRKLEDGVHVIVGTPGRVNDMINRGVLRMFISFLFVL